MKRMIIMIDDEPRYMGVYHDELKEHLDTDVFEIVFCRGLDEAYRVLKEEKDRIAIIILDIMMASGEILANEITKQGLDSGIVFFRKIIRRELGLTDTPVILLTNRQASEIYSILENGEDCVVLEKAENLPFEVFEKIRGILA